MASTEYVQRQIDAAAKTNFASDEAEKSILGCIISNYERCSDIAAQLVEDDFNFEVHRLIFKAILRAKEEQLKVDMVTVDEMLQKLTPNANAATNVMIDCTRMYISAYNADSYLQIIKELSARRRAIRLVGDIQKQLLDPAQAVNAVMDKLRTEAGDLCVGKHSWVTMREIMLNTYDYIEKRVKGSIHSITTGIPSVDTIIGGFFGGELTIIGARPAVGKSAFGMNVAISAAMHGYKVGILSREMTDIQFGQRILSYTSYMDGMKIRRADIQDEDWATLAEGMSLADRLPIEFLFTCRTVEDLRAEAQRKAAKGELDMLVVDYLQLMSTQQKFKEDRLRVGHISKGLKDIAVDLNIPVIALAQVKRYAGGGRAKMPTLEDLKDSGNLEQDADGVIFLHNPYDAEDEYVDPRDKEYFPSYAGSGFTYLCIGIAKQRQGTTGKACVLFNKKNMHYYAIDRDHRT